MLSVIIPCYNEERNIPIVVDRFRKALKNVSTELILVDNGSTDNSAAVIDKLKGRYKFIKKVTVIKNIGYGNGILKGLQEAAGDVVGYTHADLQCDPNDLLRAYDTFSKNYNRDNVMVKGRRVDRVSILTSLFHISASLLFLRKFGDINGQPKVFSYHLVRKIRNPPLGFQFDFYIQYLALKNGFQVISIPVRFRKRKYGLSKWATSLKSKIKNAAEFFTYMLRLRFLGY